MKTMARILLAGIIVALPACSTASKVVGGATLPVKMVSNTATKGIRAKKQRREQERQEEIQKTAASGQTEVLGGTVKLVRKSLGFVLIQSQGRRPPQGSVLYAQRSGVADPVAKLKLSPEVKTGFVVADIVSGDPREGDLVMWSIPSAVTRSPSATPQDAAPTTLPPEALQPMVPIDPDEWRRKNTGFTTVPSLTTSPAVPADPEADLARELDRQPVPLPPDA